MGKTKNVVMSAETTTKKVDKYAAKKEEQEAQKIVKQKGPGKNILSAKAKIDRNRVYSANEALSLVRETSFVKFDPSVELHIKVRKENLSVSVNLPFGSGKQKKVEFATDETVKKLETGKVDFDVLLATAEMMPKLVKFAKLLGPRGLMPNPKNGTLVKDEKAVEKFSTNTITLKTEKGAAQMHIAVGKLSMSDDQILQNVSAVLTPLNKQATAAFICSSMGPSVRLQVS